MRTPAGFECPFFYGDYYRGRNRQECRLIGDVPPPNNWSPDVCRNCPVPGILRANACPNLVLTGHVERIFLGLKKKVRVGAYCRQTNVNVDEPEVGCGQCHPLPPAFAEGKK